MSRRAERAIGIDGIREMLGHVAMPGSFDDFIDAMRQPWGSIMRRRRELPADDLPVSSIPIPWYRLGHRPTASSPKPSRTLAYASGDFFVQDAGSLLALAAAGADTSALAGKLICDLCAAPGGKASALVEAIDAGDPERPSGFVLANEVIRSRLGALQLNLARTGSDRYAISSLDPEVLADRLTGVFDFVLVDAPCSGQAMVARGKQKRSSLSISQIEHNASRQRRILDAAVRLLRDDGLLVYSTCTFAEAENESQIARLIDEGLATPVTADHLGLDHLEPFRSAEGCYRLWPHVHECAGSFAAILQVNAGSENTLHQRYSNSDFKAPADLRSWFTELDSSLRLWQNDSILIGWPSDAPSWVEQVATAGPELAHRTGQTWKPAHAAALRRVDRAVAIRRVELDAEKSKAFLRGETVPAETDGWQVACWRGRPIGWIKATAGIGKNHLPMSARMLGELAS